MNWFERYGIVGSYFVTVLGLFYFPTFGIPVNSFPKDSGPIIAAIFVAASLASGYFLSILSQYLYYRGCNGMLIHKEIISRCENNALFKKIFTKLEICSASSEKDIEIGLTSFLRLTLERNNIRKLKYFGVFSTKRWDIVAITSALFIASTILYGLFLLIKILNWDFNLSIIGTIASLWIPAIMLVLIESRRDIAGQIVDSHIEILKNLLRGKIREDNEK